MAGQGDGLRESEVLVMSRKLRVLGSALKADVALAAIRGDGTTARPLTGLVGRSRVPRISRNHCPTIGVHLTANSFALVVRRAKPG
jgi:hypothetical protein